ncbi:MAG: secretin N-terminal domain-containing protein [Rickettsiales bacterium]
MKQRANKLLLLLSCTVLMSGCDTDKFASRWKNLDSIDRPGGLVRQDFRDMRDTASFNKPEVTANLGNVVEPPIPDLAEIIAAPPRPKIGETQLVSLAVTDDVPLKDVLLELARLAKVDIDVDAGITGGVSLRATDRPFNEVIERISNMAGLRYSMKNGVLRVERDTPYMHIYSLDLLNSDRSANGSISTGGVGSGGGGGGSGSSGGGGSSSSITATSSSDFWLKFESSIGQILAYTPPQRSSVSTTAAQQVPAAAEKSSSAVEPPLEEVGDASSESYKSVIKPTQAAVVAPAQPQVPATSAPAVATTGANGSFYVVNRQASTLTVSATEKQHEMIKKFINSVVENTSSQVLIEAKVVEVSLNDTYQSGINWTNFGSNTLKFSGNLGNAVKGVTDNSVPLMTVLKNDIFGTGVDLSAAVKLLDEFGTTRALSSPRLNAMNNQQAVLSFVENLIYFKVTLTSTPTTTSGTTTTQGTITATSEKQSEPVGIILSLQPSINKETDEVTLGIRPTLKRFIKFVDDPGFKINLALALQTFDVTTDVGKALAGTVSQIPQVETRELDSIVKVKSGQTLVIGGLLEDKVTNTDSGVPYASEMPFFGNLFKYVDKKNTKKELVIFIRATIVGSSGSADPYDKAVYQKFMQDPRPLKF